MKRLYLILVFMTFSILGFSKEYKVYGPQGGLAMEVTLPDGFNKDTDKCPMIILMHGIFSSKNIVPIPALAKALAMWEYAKSLPYISKIGLLGHSQGGVVASMTAGILASRGESPAALCSHHFKEITFSVI